MGNFIIYMLHEFICFVFTPSVMVNFVCQLGWTTVPKYLVKHCSGCFCEVIHLDEINI